MRDLLLCLKSGNLADDVKEFYLSACRTCSMNILPRSTNQILNLCCCRCHRSLPTTADYPRVPRTAIVSYFVYFGMAYECATLLAIILHKLMKDPFELFIRQMQVCQNVAFVAMGSWKAYKRFQHRPRLRHAWSNVETRALAPKRKQKSCSR